MTYSNHVLLKGLAEYRAHMRGEAVGVPIVEEEPRKHGRRQFRRIDQLSDEEIAEINASTGSAKEIAANFGIHVNRVYAVREMFGHPKHFRAKTLTRPEQLAIARAKGEREEVAKRFGVSVPTVSKYRTLLRQGKL